MKKVLLALVLMVGMTVTLNGHFTYVWDKVAVATTPTPAPCQFAGYDQAGGLYNTSIVCATPSTGPGAGTPAAGTCIGVATPPAAGTISYTCSTPGPQATPSPSATSTSTAGPPSAVWAGSWPYTLQVNFPTGGGGGGSGLPYNIIQEAWCTGNATCTATLPQAAASSGNTLLAVVVVGAASCSGVGVTGFSAFENANDGAATALCLFTVASSSQTSVALTGGAGGSAMYVAELAGSRTADAIATATPAGAHNQTFPNVTSVSSSAAFFIGGYPDTGIATSVSIVGGGAGVPLENASVDNTSTSNGRDLVVGIKLGTVGATTLVPGLPALLTAPFTSNHFVAMSLTIK